jgi:hypothetical protein
MCACVILHNMIIDDEHEGLFNENYYTVMSVVAPPIRYNTPVSLTSILHMESKMTSAPMFSQLQLNLIEHVRKKYHQHYINVCF